MDPNSATIPYLGNRISLISNADIRYEGTLYSINTFESTVALQNVRSFGTEGRRTDDVPAAQKTYQYIVFKGKDIKDLTVCEPANQIPEDPAIVNVNVYPNANMVPPGGQAGAYQRCMMGGPNDGQGIQSTYGDFHYDGNQGRFGSQMNLQPSYPISNQGGPGGRGGYYNGENRNYSASDMDLDIMGGAIRGRGGKYTPLARGRVNPRQTSRRIVGELPPQPNSATKKELSKAFDFESSNAKFDKTGVAVALVVAESTTPSSGEVAPVVATADESVEAATATAVPAVSTPTPPATRTNGYDKTASFFDTISCETLDRQSGQDTRVDREKQRRLDCDTFGLAATVPRVSRYSRNYRRGGRRGGSYGTYRQGGGRGGYMGGGGMQGYNGSGYTGSTYPNSNYPNSNYPNSNYPNSNYPNNNYPNTSYPNSNYPGNNYPGNNYNYPNGNYQSGNYPTSNYPTSNYPSANRFSGQHSGVVSGRY